MGSKRNIASLSNSDSEDQPVQPISKRARNKPQSQSKQQSDLAYGQKSMFPSLDDLSALGNDGLEWEDQDEALEYLKSVR